MTVKKIFVTRATGQTGLSTIKWLTEKSQNLEVYAAICRTEKATQEAQLKGYNVKTCVLECDHASLVKQFSDVEHLFIIPSPAEDMFAIARGYIDAAKEAGVKSILLLSVVGADRKDYAWGAHFRQIEDYLFEVWKEPWCIIRSHLYTQSFTLFKAQIKAGTLPMPIGEGKFAPIDVADIGYAASTILKNCAPHKGQIYQLTGPELYSGEEIACAFAKLLAFPVHYRNVYPVDTRHLLAVQNVPETEINGLLEFYGFVRENRFEDFTEDYRKVTGKPPNTLADFLTANRGEFVGKSMENTEKQ